MSIHDRVLNLDVGGSVFSVSRQTLMTIPHTRLSGLTRLSKCYDHARNVYYFDRNPVVFMSILDAYRYGELHIPPFMCRDQVIEEMQWWGIPEEVVSTCCRRCLDDYKSQQASITQLLNELDENFDDIRKRVRRSTARPEWMINVWLHMEYPNYSKSAKIWAIFLGLLTMISVVILGLMFFPIFREPVHHSRYMTDDGKYTVEFPTEKAKMLATTHIKTWLNVLDCVVNIILSLEVLIRFLISPQKKKFLKSTLNWIDILAALAFVCSAAISASDKREEFHDPKNRPYLSIILIFLCLRALRVFRLATIIKALKVLILVLCKNFKELFTLGLFIAIAMIIYSMLIFYAEMKDDTTFPNYITALWWSFITMTSVGYGDHVPKTYAGYLVGTICAVTGLLLSGLVIPIISNKFSLIYSLATGNHISRWHDYLTSAQKKHSDHINSFERADSIFGSFIHPKFTRPRPLKRKLKRKSRK